MTYRKKIDDDKVVEMRAVADQKKEQIKLLKIKLS